MTIMRDDLDIEFEKLSALGGLSGSQLRSFFDAADCPVQWIRALDPDRKVVGLIVKPNSHGLRDTFGFHHELPMICSWHADFQPRTANLRRLIEESVVPGRLERDVTFVLSTDPLLGDKLEKLDTTVRTYIPLSPQGIISSKTSGGPSVWLREQLQIKLFARDAFDKAGPVEGHEFFGRRKLIQDLLSQLSKGSSIGLYGLRKVGKTSVIRNLSDAARELGLTFYFVHVDLLAATPSSKSYSYLMWMIGRALQQQVNVDLRLKIGLRWLGRIRRYEDVSDLQAFEIGLDGDIRALTGYLESMGGRVVIVIDEIELLFPLSDIRAGFVGYDEFLGYLRGLSQNNAISIMVVGVNPNISEAQFLGRGRRNPMYGYFSNRYAPSMGVEEVRDMVKTLGRSSGVRFDDGALDHLYAITGGHPSLARKYCSAVIRDRKRPITIFAEDIDSARDRFLRDESTTFAEIVSVVKEYYPEEFSALTKVAMAESGIPAKDVNRQTRSHLEGYQLVTENKGILTLKNDLLREWFAGLREIPTAYQPTHSVIPATINAHEVNDLLGELEIQLRRFVRKRLTEKYGVAIEKRIALAVGTEETAAARSRRDTSLMRFQPERDVSIPDLLEYIYLGHLLQIIGGPDWELFRTAFDGDKSKIDIARKFIPPVRNELAHRRTVRPRQLMRAYVEAGDVLENISEH